MENEITYYLVAASIVFFLAYWILGGAFFVVIGLIRSARTRKVRFSCLFTIVCAAAAYGAARLGIYWSEDAVADGLKGVSTISESIIGVFSLSFASMFLALIVGFAATVVISYFMMILSKSNEPAWYEVPKTDLPEMPDNEYDEGDNGYSV